MSNRVVKLLLVATTVGLAVARPAASGPPAANPDSSQGANGGKKPKYRSQALRGRVVWLADAMLRRYGVETDADAVHAQVALDADDGMLYPIVKDFRGRAFHADERLRNVEVELLVRRYEGSPFVQVLRIYTLKPDGKYELDYWCDVCRIPMYELKPCECCQGPIRIRERHVENDPDGKGTKGSKRTKP